MRRQLVGGAGAEQAWAPHHSVDIVVDNGVVELRGFLTDERQRVALRIAAENIPVRKECHETCFGKLEKPGRGKVIAMLR